MKRIIHFILFFSFIGLTALAQGPGGRPGGSGGGENGRPSRSTDGPSSAFSMDDKTPKGNAKVTGFVIDSAVTVAVEYANIALVNEANNQVQDGTMADENGKFQFTRVAEGTYTFKVTFIGYEDTFVKGVKIKKGDDIDLGVIKLAISSKVLDEVTVTGLKSLIEEKVDRLVYNAENDVTSKGGDGSDVLRKVPMLSVDLDGNVSLRGSSNIKVLINNKPSTIVASSVADALKMIPADLIKTVEVITSPSAKYDAEGTSGIINIITKKSSIQGYNLSLNSGVGFRGSNLGLNGNLRIGKLGFSLGGFGRSFYNKANTTLDQTTIGKLYNTTTVQSSDAKDNGLFGRYNLGIDYEINKSAYLNGSVSFGTRNFKRYEDMITDVYQDTDLITSQNRLVDSKNSSNNVDVNLDYVKIFKPSHEWSISTQYSQNNLTNNFTADIISLEGTANSQQQNINLNINKEITLQTDYMVPVKSNQLFEVGVKGIFRDVNSDYKYLVGIIGSLEADSRNPAGILQYNQNIKAGYLQYTYSTKNKLTFKVGTRYEHTSIDAVDKGLALSIPSYDNLVPSVNISKTLGGGTTLKLAYNNRISRPGLEQLNPNFNTANPQNIRLGNPSLRPEISNNVEFGISKIMQRNYMNLTFFGRQTNNSILQITSPSDTLLGALVTTYENIGVQKTAGANLFGNFFLTPKWTINGGIDMYYKYLEGQVQTLDGFELADNDGIVISGRLMSMLSLKNDWKIQAFTGMRGRDISLQGFTTGMAFYNIGLQKGFKDDKGSIGIGFENFINGMTRISESNSAIFTQRSVNYIHNQNIKVNFSYKLGNMKFVERKKTKSVNNTDVKGGSEGAQGGGF